jgi:prolipoprotein diacylglyceryl transferase
VPSVLSIFASIPSPGDNAINIGPLELRAYGLAIALGVIAAVWIARVRWAARGGDPDDISRIAVWAVFAGLVGARLYHVITDHDRFEGRWLHAFYVWEGGLGIPGGLIAGVAVGAYVAHRLRLPVPELLDVVAPALPVAQAIGRLGNWFNQELFGRPTDLPWGLEIDPQHRPAGYLDVATFHPTFLYEALWNLALAGGLVWWERRRPNAHPGRLFALYVAGYSVGRIWVEALRIDPAAHLFGVRWNIWMSAIAFFAAVGWLIYDSRRRPATRAVAAEAAVSAEASADEAAAADATAEPNAADEHAAAEAATAGPPDDADTTTDDAAADDETPAANAAETTTVQGATTRAEAATAGPADDAETITDDAADAETTTAHAADDETPAADDEAAAEDATTRAEAATDDDPSAAELRADDETDTPEPPADEEAAAAQAATGDETPVPEPEPPAHDEAAAEAEAAAANRGTAAESATDDTTVDAEAATTERSAAQTTADEPGTGDAASELPAEDEPAAASSAGAGEPEPADQPHESAG